MEASMNMPAAQQQASGKRVNWSMMVRVGLVVAAIALLVGYALKVTYESVIRGGVVQTGDHFKVELRQMSGFDMDQVGGTVADVPKQFRELDGKKVILEGEIAPGGDLSDKVSVFSICYSVQNCCYGGPPQAQHFVLCKTPPGRTVRNYMGRPGGVRVSGTLHVNVIKEGGKIQSVFQMDLDRVEPIS
jgi:hypothetical protein